MRIAKIAWALWWVVLLTFVVGLIFTARNRTAFDTNDIPIALEIGFLLTALAFGTVGRVVATRRSRHPIGWLLLALGVGLGMGLAAQGFADHAFAGDTVAVPGASVAAWVSTLLVASPVLFAPFLFLFLLFPDGRLPTPRWRPLAWIGALSAAGLLVLVAVNPGPLPEQAADVQNPFGVSSAAALVRLALDPLAIVLMVCVTAGALSPFMRYRSTGATERRQLKWLAFAASLLGGALVQAPLWWMVSPSLGEQVWPILVLIAFSMIPGSIAVAILRYRLYDIDRLISRTVSYALVTGLAVAMFAAVVVIPTSSIGGGDAPPALIAVATLAAAGVFNPLRRRIQALVDRRFNRARYDAQVVADGFGSRLREPRDLDRVTADLAGTVAATMRPDRLGIWVRA